MEITKELLEQRISTLAAQKNIMETQVRKVQEEALTRVAKLNADINATVGAIQLCTELLETLDKPDVVEEPKADDAESSGRNNQQN